ncbi:MAG: hypothetical protein ACOZE5_04965 [Verrucomicrobiota bacterium]
MSACPSSAPEILREHWFVSLLQSVLPRGLLPVVAVVLAALSGAALRADTVDQVAAGAEWVGMAVGIFVEPVDWIMTAVEIYRDPTNPWSYIGLIPGIPAGAGKLAKKTISLATDILRQLPGGRIIKIGTKDAGMDHILRRHAHGTVGEPNAGKFKRGWHMSQIMDAIETAIQRSTPQPAGPGKVMFEAELDEVIGHRL